MKLDRSSQLAIALAALAILVAGMMFWRTTARGLGLGGDTVDYLSSTRNFLAGRGFRTLDGQAGTTPLTQFPPAYPVALAAISVGGGDIVARARIMHLFLHVLIVLLAGVLAWQVTRSRICGAAVALFMSITHPLLILTTLMMSEALFFVFLLLTFIGLGAAFSRRPLLFAILAGLAAAGTELTRYVGVVLIPVGMIALLLGVRGWRDKVIATLAFGFCATAPMVLWAMRNYSVAGKATGRALVYHPAAWAEYRQGFNTLGAWVLPDTTLLPKLVGWFIPIMIVIVLLTCRRLGKSAPSGPAQRALLYTLGLFVVMHIGFVVASRILADANIRLKDRHLAPIFPIFLTMVAAALLAFVRGRSAQIVTIAALLAIAGFNSWRTWGWVRRYGDMGQAYSTKQWHKSETMKIVNSAPPGLPIYTDGYDVIYLRTGRIVYQLPKATLQSTLGANPKLEQEVAKMLERLRKGNGWVVYFNRMDRDNYLLNEKMLRERVELIPLKETQPADGRIYRIAQIRDGPR